MTKGILALAAAAAVLAIPVAASGDAVKAKRGDNFQIRFTLKSNAQGEPIALKRFRFRKLSATCNGGVTRELRGRFPSIKVNDRRRFSESVHRNGKHVRVKGRVSRDLDKVRGTLRARGAFAGATGCDSGREQWVAR